MVIVSHSTSISMHPSSFNFVFPFSVSTISAIFFLSYSRGYGDFSMNFFLGGGVVDGGVQNKFVGIHVFLLLFKTLCDVICTGSILLLLLLLLLFFLVFVVLLCFVEEGTFLLARLCDPFGHVFEPASTRHSLAKFVSISMSPDAVPMIRAAALYSRNASAWEDM